MSGVQKQLSEKTKKQNKKKRRRILQAAGIGCLFFLLGVYVGSAYEASVLVSAKELPTEETGHEFQQTEEIDNANSLVQSEEQNEEVIQEEPVEVEQLPTDWNLLLVNGTHTLPTDFKIELGEIGEGHQIDVRAVEDFKAMIRDAKRQGFPIYVLSSYRSMDKQVELHHDKIEELVKEGYPYEEACALAATVVAFPGTSEHQLGLAVDLVSAEYLKLDEKQENTKGFQWLQQHSWEYGFILRYPNGKTAITGIIYEPWHFRYVGKEVAKEITEQGLTLEEYVGAAPVWSEEEAQQHSMAGK